MGGAGSGNRCQFGKRTVEDSLVLSMRDLRKWLYRDAAGALTWRSAGGRESSVGFVVAWDPDGPAVVLHYRWRDAEDVRVLVRLEATPVHLGGVRWWFTCPLVRGVACRRRAGKLYLPPGGRYFGCRVCHDLTYRSCQESTRRRGCSPGSGSGRRPPGCGRRGTAGAGRMPDAGRSAGLRRNSVLGRGVAYPSGPSYPATGATE
jgi:hypothetical protein